MRVAQLSIKNFRGISEGKLTLPGHVVLIGDNNSGKSSIIEAIDLALGPIASTARRRSMNTTSTPAAISTLNVIRSPSKWR